MLIPAFYSVLERPDWPDPFLTDANDRIKCSVVRQEAFCYTNSLNKYM